MPNYPYNASTPAAILFAVLFGITLLGHVFQAVQNKTLYMLVLIIATAMQVLGYATRYVAIQQSETLWPVIVSQVSIIVAPAFLAAQDYMIVGRMMSFVGPESTVISHTIVTKLFVCLDILCVLTQSTGATILSNTSDSTTQQTVALGRWILIGGLIAQIFSFMVFVAFTILFDIKSRKVVPPSQLKELQILRKLFIAFYVSAGIIIGRSLYRTVEFGTIDFGSQTQGYLYNNEWPFYALDAVPILFATILFNVIHPGTYIPSKKGLRIDGSYEQPRKHWWSKASATSATVSSDALTGGDAMAMSRV